MWNKLCAPLLAAWLVSCASSTSDFVYDADGDGFVAAHLSGADCDDTDPSVHPDAEEVCNDGIDNDCDGFTDDRGVGEQTFYVDHDRDGFGVASSAFQACAWSNPNVSLVAGDCDDRHADVHPGVAEDSCDGVDSDCDGDIDEDQRFAVNGTAFPTLDEALAQVAAGTGNFALEVCGRARPVAIDTHTVSAGRLTVSGAADGPELVLVPSKGGSAFRVAGDGELILEHVTVQGAATAPAIVVEAQGSVSVTASSLRNNAAGGLSLDGSGKTAFVSARVTDSELADNGGSGAPVGAIAASGAFSLEVEGTLLTGNRAVDGGALHLSGPADSSVSMTGGELAGNHADETGGALHVDGVSVALERVAISSNAAKVGGAAYATLGDATLTLTACSISDNHPSDLEIQGLGTCETSETEPADVSCTSAACTGCL